MHASFFSNVNVLESLVESHQTIVKILTWYQRENTIKTFFVAPSVTLGQPMLIGKMAFVSLVLLGKYFLIYVNLNQGKLLDGWINVQQL
jgi:hypothetical protein